MTWEEFKGLEIVFPTDYEQTDIECPKCNEHLRRYTGMVIATYPPKYRYDCPKCGWCGVK